MPNARPLISSKILLTEWRYLHFLTTLHCPAFMGGRAQRLLSSESGEAGPFATTAEPSATATKSNVFVKLQELLSLSASQILQRKGLDSVGDCLNDLAASGLLSTESVVYLSNILE